MRYFNSFTGISKGNMSLFIWNSILVKNCINILYMELKGRQYEIKVSLSMPFFILKREPAPDSQNTFVCGPFNVYLLYLRIPISYVRAENHRKWTMLVLSKLGFSQSDRCSTFRTDGFDLGTSLSGLKMCLERDTLDSVLIPNGPLWHFILLPRNLTYFTFYKRIYFFNFHFFCYIFVYFVKIFFIR